MLARQLVDKLKASPGVPMATITIDDYPQLALLCWNRSLRIMEEPEVLQLYETGWRFIEQDQLVPSERSLITRLVNQYGNGVLNV